MKKIKTIFIFMLIMCVALYNNYYCSNNIYAMSITYDDTKTDMLLDYVSEYIDYNNVNDNKSGNINDINDINDIKSEENLNFFQKIWKSIVNVFKSIIRLFTLSSDDVSKEVTDIVNMQINTNKDLIIDKAIELTDNNLGGTYSTYLEDLKNKDIVISQDVTKEAIDVAKGFFNINTDNNYSNNINSESNNNIITNNIVNSNANDETKAILDIVNKFVTNKTTN